MFLEKYIDSIVFSYVCVAESEHIVKEKGGFIRYVFHDGKEILKEVISFNEYFIYKSRGMNFAIVLSELMKWEILISLLIGLFIREGISHGISVHLLSNINKAYIGVFLVGCLVYFLRRGTFSGELCNMLFSVALIVKVASTVVSVYGYGVFVKGLSIFLVGIYIIACAMIASVKINKGELYKELSVRYFE